jgi:hypothetical protein
MIETRRFTRALGSTPVKAGLALVVLHTLTSFPYPWENVPFVTAWLRVNPDLLFCLTVGILLVQRFGIRRDVGVLVALGIVFVPLYRFGFTVMPVFYGRPLDPFFDVDMVPGLVHLLLHSFPGWLQRVMAGGATVIGVVAFYLIYRVASAVLRASRDVRIAYGLLIGFQLLVIVTWLGRAAALDATRAGVGRSMMARAIGAFGEVLRTGSWKVDSIFERRLAVKRSLFPEVNGGLQRLEGADVYVCFVESYGRALFRKPDTLAAIRGWVPALERDLAAGGYSACTAFFHPSVIGGGSALAHAEFLSGIPVENTRILDRLLMSAVKALPRFFREAGYRTITVQPATYRPWPEGMRFYGFDEELFLNAFPYDGRQYHWGTMPDQYALNHVLDTVVRPADRPLFLHYVSVTSHAPFTMIPPYFEDWSRAGEPAAFRGEPAKEYGIHWTSYYRHPRLEAAYLDSIHYSLRTLVGFCLELDRPSLVIILGDHQPPLETLTANDPSSDVPVHVLANRKALIEPFRSRGFHRGWIPPAESTSVSFSLFLYHFLAAFSRPEHPEADGDGR